ncbi:DUF4139 domain-containing protein [Longimicrobium terrae]|uniref:DUF4139 domain-containing protein n=1 Tax=Longimicrobium terrae TaxID=1639882 RepID=A0A841GS90_9BACT|nr:DUF4139 domain-containing protein [Longimicrobium terrae]MBB4635716.1 hypothetical protein [Longimicrobium terrae]MBB6070110.1 hypothetical protein [Longimicrobium terrae]NNC33013.1 DUF4139 domain-containing protein [Longimicrobium terrae]
MTHLRLALAAVLAAVPVAAQTPVISTAADSRDVSLTIYNGGYAVLREQREVPLTTGMNVIRYEDVAQTIQPATVSVSGRNSPIRVREQNYQFDLVSPQAILDKSIGRTVRFRRARPDGGVEVLEGTLLSTGANGTVLRTTDGRLVLNPQGEVEVTELPAGLISRPSLLWMLDSERGGRQTLDVSYLAGGLGWSADYVAVFDSADGRVDLTGWVTLTNGSGTTWREAQLQLMAGDVRRVSSVIQGRVAGANLQREAPAAYSAPAFVEEGFFEYHLYTLQGRTTLANNETKQMTLLTAPGARVRRRLVFDSQRSWNWNAQPGAGVVTTEVKAAIMLTLSNTEANGMGMPLPAGVVRTYKRDARGNIQFLGEDRISHTPRDEDVRLYLGDAFDVVATRRVVEDRTISDRANETVVEITVRNHKDTAADVDVTEHFWGEGRILNSTAESTRVDARTINFAVSVPARGERVITYRLRQTW